MWDQQKMYEWMNFFYQEKGYIAKGHEKYPSLQRVRP